VARHAAASGFAVEGLVRSPLLGPSGNVEFLANLHVNGQTDSDDEIAAMIDGVMAAA
jgi:hypothetical protein